MKGVNWFANCVVTNLKHNRVRITSPLAHFLVSPLKRQFIVSYPRSGSTWMRTMLTNILDPDAQSNPAIFNKTIPGTTLTRLWWVYNAPAPYILSTHSVYRPDIRRALYIIRDGRESMLSLFRYTTVRVGKHMDFGMWFEFYMRGYFGPRWDQHVMSWLTNGPRMLGADFLLIRYEDCLVSPQRELAKACDFLGIRYDASDLERAVKLARIENMRKWERKIVGDKNDDESFYRGKGNLDEWLTLLTDDQRKEFLSVSSKALRLGGYFQ